MTYLIAYPSDVFWGSKLSQLTKIKSQKDNAYSFSVYCLLSTCLKDYGIKIWGETFILEKNGEQSNFRVRHAIIDKYFPIDNEFVFKQMYDYKNALVNITIQHEQANNHSLSFNYNLDNKECTLLMQKWGNQELSKHYLSFAAMFKDLMDFDFSLDIFNAEYESCIQLLY